MSSMNSKAHSADRQYWRSLDELADNPEFRKWAEREFPEREFPESASEMDNSWSRRSFLTMMGASLALAGLTSCRRPVEKIIPYVKPPDEITPGLPLYYATTMPRGNSAYGLVVESHEGRPTKIEGNKKCPSTQGRSNLQMQAAILGLYDPDRSKTLLHQDSEATWEDFLSGWSTISTEAADNDGAGLAVLSEPFSSPTLARLKDEFMRQFPGAMWVAWEPVSNENMYSGSELASGTRYQPLPDYANAEVILSLDADFLLTESESVAAAAGFASGRNVSAESDSMNRLYIIESLFSLTGASADHRLAVAPDQIAGIVRAIAVELRNLGVAVSPDITGEITEVSPEIQDWVRPLAADLVRAGRNALICVGRRQPAAIHALAMHLNQALGNTGTTISYTLPADSVHSSLSDLITLTRRMNSGEISELVILGGNPVYNAPDDLEFVSALSRVATSIHLASHVDETSSETTWHIPRAHFLESWGDARTVDGSVGIIQPLIEPLFGGISDIEMLAAIAGMSDNSSYDILRQTWRHEWGARFDTHWPQALHDGIIEGSAAMTVVPEVNSDRIASELKALPPAGSSVQLQFLFHADNCLGDGTDANNGWLQELPDPITKLAWDNAATVSPATAEQLGATNEDMVWLDFGHCELKLPIWIVPGQADGVIGLGLGYGRTRAGHVGNNRGFNTYALRTSSTMHIARGVTATLADQTYALANTQDHGSMEGRPIVREASLEDYRAHPDFATEAAPHPPLVSLWEERSYDQGYQWGMAIDLTKCIGCGVCTLACQSENNIPIVGKTETRKGREMHWIRIDRYFVGDVDTPQIVHQPVACQHCENAPCEQVCPVAATVHDEEGLNAMVYNRCIGTRYCANNCPYKVRRFNFFNFTGDTPEVTKMAQNPDVTVRSRGVMEKCSYCLQRITAGKRRAKLEGREVNDGEIKVACQQSCPTDAFVFGNIRDPESRVAQVKKQNRSYDLLAELNVKPRTSYLAKLRNPNPEMPS